MKYDKLTRIFREYFSFTRSERRGIFVLSVLLLLFFALNVVIEHIEFQKPEDFSALQEEIKAWQNKDKKSEQLGGLSLFDFDPNAISPEEFALLDLPARIKNNILRYREKGGYFNTPEDVRKIYGMNDSIFARLLPFIRISRLADPEQHYREEAAVRRDYFFFDPNSVTDAEMEQLGFNSRQRQNLSAFRRKGGVFRDKNDLQKIYGIDSALFERLKPWIEIVPLPEAVKEKAPLPLVELNLADSLQLLRLPGIGPAFAGRILKYRNMLGGFHSTSQLLEVYNLEADRYAQFAALVTADSSQVRKIRINFAGPADLKHPYLQREQVRRLLESRQKEGPFTDLNQLLEKNVLDENTFRKIKPYLTCR